MSINATPYASQAWVNRLMYVCTLSHCLFLSACCHGDVLADNIS